MSKNTQKMPTEQNNEAQNVASDSAQRLEAIKNLIFGENILQIDNDFQALKNHIEKRKEELEVFIGETRKELFQTIDNLSTDLNIRISDLEHTLEEKTTDLDHKKVDRKSLGTLLMHLGEKIMKD